MTKVYDSNFRILVKWIERMYRALHEQGSSYQPGDGGPIDKIMQAINALHDLKREPPSKNVPPSPHFQVGQQWIDNALEDIFDFNAMGNEYICSTVEAVLKCNGIKRLFDRYSTPFYFRGEHIFGWELKSRLGRKISIDWDARDPHNVTQEELELLSDFQNRCHSDPATRTVVFGESTELLPNDHAGWWSLMQHYDDQHGTRLIDVTSSLNCALFFASANWDGTVDDSVDGKLYMFPYQPGRGETDSPDRHKGELIGPEDARQRSVADYFKIEKHLEIPRFRVSPARNDRALSQDGYFIWQPHFDKSLRTFQLFAFRIHREFKKSIVKELAAMGYTRDRILSKNRFVI